MIGSGLGFSEKTGSRFTIVSSSSKTEAVDDVEDSDSEGMENDERGPPCVWNVRARCSRPPTMSCIRVASASAWVRRASRASSPTMCTRHLMRSLISGCSRTHQSPGQRAMLWESSHASAVAVVKSSVASRWNQGRIIAIARRTAPAVVSRSRRSTGMRRNRSDISWQKTR